MALFFSLSAFCTDVSLHPEHTAFSHTAANTRRTPESYRSINLEAHAACVLDLLSTMSSYSKADSPGDRHHRGDSRLRAQRHDRDPSQRGRSRTPRIRSRERSSESDHRGRYDKEEGAKKRTGAKSECATADVVAGMANCVQAKGVRHPHPRLREHIFRSSGANPCIDSLITATSLRSRGNFWAGAAKCQQASPFRISRARRL